MKLECTSTRLKQMMEQRNLRQIDILNLAKPYCEQLGIKLNKNDLSQYVSGKVEPRQDKLTILGLALDVSEVWLMGYDVPKHRDHTSSPQANAPRPSDNVLSEFSPPLSRDARTVAIAYDMATQKEQQTVQLVLSDYLEELTQKAPAKPQKNTFSSPSTKSRPLAARDYSGDAIMVDQLPALDMEAIEAQEKDTDY